MRFKKIFLAVWFFYTLASLSIAAAQATVQNDLPDFYNKIFNPELVIAILAVKGAVKDIRNMFNVKGFVAVIVTLVAACAYGMIQFGIGMNGVVYGLVVGLLAAVTFFWTKNIGTVSSAFNLGTKEGLAAAHSRTQTFLNLLSRDGVFASLIRIFKYVVLRK